jgi:hypothetical protein
MDMFILFNMACTMQINLTVYMAIQQTTERSKKHVMKKAQLAVRSYRMP